jgi:hypothetical protein
MWKKIISLLSIVSVSYALNALIDFEVIGGIAENNSTDIAIANGLLFNDTLSKLEPGDTLFISNKTFTLQGGIKARDLKDITFQIDGTIEFLSDRDLWPKQANGNVEECIYLENIENIKFTSSGKGTINGNGRAW